MLHLITISGSKVSTNDNITCPSVIVNDTRFEDAVNYHLYAMFGSMYDYKLSNAKSSLSKATKAIRELSIDSDDYETQLAKLAKTKETAEKNIETYTKVLSELIKIEVVQDADSKVSRISHMYALNYVNFAGVNDDGKAQTYTLNGIHALLIKCRTYNKTYADVQDWTPARKAMFTELKNDFNAIANDFLHNDEANEFMKKYDHSISSRDMTKLLASCEEKDIFKTSTGTVKTVKSKVDAFQKNVLATIWKLAINNVSDTSTTVTL